MSVSAVPQPPPSGFWARRPKRDDGVIAISVAVITGIFLVISAFVGAPRDGDKIQASPSPSPSPSASSPSPSSSDAGAQPVALVVDPEDGAVVTDWPTKSSVRGTLDRPLADGHTLWFATKALEEQGLHPARESCQVVGLSFVCPVLYLGRQDEHGKAFRLELWDADASATGRLEAYAGRAAGDNTPVSRPDGARVTQDMLLHRG